jgi:3-oxoacyl-[acyl-carrier protein] reductase
LGDVLSESKPLRGRVAVVTGGARGLGAAYALRLAELGADVGIIDIDLRSYEAFPEDDERLRDVPVPAAVEELGARASAVEADLTDPGEVDRAIASIRDALGPIGVLVANAGGSNMGVGPSKPATELTPEEIRQVFERNVYATMFCCSAVAPDMKQRREGKIILVASDAALIPMFDGTIAHYGAAKAAIVVYTKYLAAELGPHNINVNAIAPGYIATGRLLSAFREMGIENLEQQVALRRLGKPEECASVVAMLATDASDYMSGALVEIGARIR